MIITAKKFVSMEEARTHYIRALNAAVDALRERIRTKDQFIYDELTLANKQAARYQEKNYEGTPPATVVSLAQALNLPPREAADRILDVGAQFEQMLERTWRMRLAGNAKIAAASTVAEARKAYEAALASVTEE